MSILTTPIIKQLLAQAAAQAAAKQAGGANNPTPGQIPQSAISLAAPPAMNYQPPSSLGQMHAAYSGGDPFAALRGSGHSRVSTPSDPSWWYTYGAGPEQSYFSDNLPPSAAAPAPAQTPGAPMSGAGSIPYNPLQKGNISSLAGAGLLGAMPMTVLQRLLQQGQATPYSGRVQIPAPVSRPQAN